MSRIRKFGVPTPSLYLIDEIGRKIYMEYMGDHAFTVKQFLYSICEGNDYTHPILIQLVEKIGAYIGIMHQND